MKSKHKIITYVDDNVDIIFYIFILIGLAI